MIKTICLTHRRRSGPSQLRHGGAVLLLAAVVFGANPGARAQTAPDIGAAIDELVSANHILYHQGVLDGFGHVSIRDPRDPQRFLMSRARSPGLIGPKDIMEFDIEGKPVDPRGREVYQERFIHAEIYKARPDVNAVVHSHSPTVIPFSVTQVPMRPVVTTASFLYTGVPVFDTRKVAGMTSMLIANNALGKSLAETLGASSVVLLRGHGNAVVGPDLHRVVSRAVYTEVNARLQMQALALGGPITYIAPEEGTLMEKQRDRYAPRSAQGQDRTWEMWKSEADRALGGSKR